MRRIRTINIGPDTEPEWRYNDIWQPLMGGTPVQPADETGPLGIVIVSQEEYDMMEEEGTLNPTTIYYTYDSNLGQLRGAWRRIKGNKKQEKKITYFID